MSETLRRIDHSISQYSAALMSNTKWREVLSIVGEIAMPVQFAFICEEIFLPQTRFPNDGCNENSTKDCTSHGPFYLKEIYAIKCPIYESKTNPKTGAKYECKERSEEFIQKLNAVGKLPIALGERYIHIKGYQ